MEKKIMNLEEKVYLLMYGKPDYIANISEIIFAKRSKSIDRAVKQLKKDKWIKETKYEHPSLPPHALPTDGRMLTGNYYCAKVKPLFDSIKKDLEEKNISLTSEEKESLTRYLDSESFRATVREITVENGELRSKNIDFSTVKRNLCYLSTYMIFTLQWMEGRTIRASPAIVEPLMKRITYPIFSLGPSLCKKLICLDLYTSSLVSSSFEDVRDMIESIFESVLKDNMIKLDKATREKILEENKDQPGIWVDLEKREIKYIEKRKAKQRQKISTGGKEPQLKENLPQADKGKSRDKVAK